MCVLKLWYINSRLFIYLTNALVMHSVCIMAKSTYASYSTCEFLTVKHAESHAFNQVACSGSKVLMKSLNAENYVFIFVLSTGWFGGTAHVQWLSGRHRVLGNRLCQSLLPRSLHQSEELQQVDLWDHHKWQSVLKK